MHVKREKGSICCLTFEAKIDPIDIDGCVQRFEYYGFWFKSTLTRVSRVSGGEGGRRTRALE